jgi:glycine oxidase
MAGDGDIIVIGGGVVGLLSARRLAVAGHRVTLVERGRVGRGTSRAGGGIMGPLAPWTKPEALNALAHVSLPMLGDLTATLADDTGIDCEYRVSGMIYLQCEDAEAATAYARRTALEVQRLDSRRLAAVEPAAARMPGASLLFPAVAQLRNPRFLDALAADLVRRGIRVIEDAGQATLEATASGFRVQAGRHGALAATEVVVAAGAWSGTLLEPHGVALPVRPLRGQMIWYLLPRPVLGHLLVRGHRYVIPRREGVVLVGSTSEDVGFDAGTTADGAAELRAAAAEMVPLLGTLAMQGQWAGLNPASPGDVPLIGPVPGLPGLWVNTGHGWNGVGLAPGSAELLVALMGGQHPPLDPAPYDPAGRMAQSGMDAYNASY